MKEKSVEIIDLQLGSSLKRDRVQKKGASWAGPLPMSHEMCTSPNENFEPGRFSKIPDKLFSLLKKRISWSIITTNLEFIQFHWHNQWLHLGKQLITFKTKIYTFIRELSIIGASHQIRHRLIIIVNYVQNNHVKISGF